MPERADAPTSPVDPKGVPKLSKRWILLFAVFTAGIVAVACGSDDDALSPARVGGDSAPTATATSLPATAAPPPPSGAVNQSDPGTPCPVAGVGRTNLVATPGTDIDQGRSYEAVIKTSKGDIRLELFDEDAPVTVNNFVHLARCGYYDNTIFHRVIANFMAQAGQARGGGGPGYSIPDEFSERRHDGPGVMSMANAGFGTGGSQFFITHRATPHLDGIPLDGTPKVCEAQNVSCHAVFGQVIDGQHVVDSLVVTGPGVTPDTIQTVEIIEK